MPIVRRSRKYRAIIGRRCEAYAPLTSGYNGLVGGSSPLGHTAHFAAFSRVQMRDVRSLPPVRVAMSNRSWMHGVAQDRMGLRSMRLVARGRMKPTSFWRAMAGAGGQSIARLDRSSRPRVSSKSAP